jgi:phosphate transport system protein
MSHIAKAIDDLKSDLIGLGSRVEKNVREAIEALAQRDIDLAQFVIEGDHFVDDLEVEIEEECLKILALHQPVAIDLRKIIAALKITNDLERIGDLAVNIAERSKFIATRPTPSVALDFPLMCQKTQWMLKNSLDAFVKSDGDLARTVCKADDEVDAINSQMYGQVQGGIRDNVEDMEVLLHLLSISRHLERIADLATNIGEDVIYMIDGEIVRHSSEDYEKKFSNQ